MKKLIALFSLICLLTVSTNSFAGGNDKKSKGKEKSCCQGKDQHQQKNQKGTEKQNQKT